MWCDEIPPNTLEIVVNRALFLWTGMNYATCGLSHGRVSDETPPGRVPFTFSPHWKKILGSWMQLNAWASLCHRPAKHLWYVNAAGGPRPSSGEDG